ncbi:MAG: DNA polymerase III subunit gamma/tau [Hyphomonadaceae bacterium]|nr:DNA polymerase III subunit gamma/tau [Hyphomonadaceae bacterium]
MSETESPEARDDATFSMFSDAETGPPDAGYQVLARKYRPLRFEDLIGQEAMVRTLKNAFETDRIAHAFMLTGVRGVGKTTTARLLARGLNYRTDTVNAPSIKLDPSGEHCEAIMAGRHPDVLELDAASRTGVADMRDLLDGARYAPVSARYKVYVIDEVHMLSTAAFNALLKTLEEPPAHVKFIFATTEIRKVPITVLSRCQRFDLKRLDPAALAVHLGRVAQKEGAKVSEEGLALIARAAEGSVRDGLSILDQAIVQTTDGGEVSGAAVRDMLGLGDRGRLLDVFDMAVKGEAKAALKEADEQVQAGADPLVILKDLMDIAAEVAAAQVAGDDYTPTAPKDWVDRTRAIAQRLTPAQCARLWQMLLSGYRDAQVAPDTATALRMVLLRVAASAGLPSPEEAARMIAEARGAGGKGAPGGAGGGSGPSSFSEIIDRLQARREIILQGEVETYIRPGDVAYGQLRCALEPDAPDGLLRKLALFLEKDTGVIWQVDQVETAEETFKARKARILDEKIADACRHPAVAAALDALPGARVIDVRQAGPVDPAHDETNVVDMPRRRA